MSPVSYLKLLKKRYQFFAERRWTGEYELLVLPSLVDSAKLAIDVGGNMGSYTYQLSKLAREVLTFEPNPAYVGRIQSLHLGNVRIEQVALSDRVGTAKLQIPLVTGGREDQGMASIDERSLVGKSISRTFDVPVKRLDDYKLEHADFIKIDVEGHEESVLAGALSTLQRCAPTLLIEIEERRNPGSLGRIRGLLSRIGYSGFFFFNEKKKPIESFDLDLHQPTDPVWDNSMYTRRSFPLVNNFVFEPPRRNS